MDWPLLAGVAEEERRRFLSVARRRRFSKGEVVFHAGDLGDSLHLVARGRLAVWVTGPVGDAIMTSVLGVGDYFGELALVDEGNRRSATVRTLEPSETLALRRDDFEQLRARHASVDRALVAVLAGQVRRLSDILAEVTYVPAQSRVLRRLLAVAELWGGARPGVVIPVTQDDMAGLAGTTRPTANRTLREAEDAGLLALGRGRIKLLDPTGLADRAR